jgi:hypothetical protein
VPSRVVEPDEDEVGVGADGALAAYQRRSLDARGPADTKVLRLHPQEEGGDIH